MAHTHYTAYVLTRESRDELLKTFNPRFKDFIGHHITMKYNVPAGSEMPAPADIKVVGYVTDGMNLEALVVSVNGYTEREDGSHFHITWSLNRSTGFTPAYSNTVLRKFKIQKLSKPITIKADPALL